MFNNMGVPETVVLSSWFSFMISLAFAVPKNIFVILFFFGVEELSFSLVAFAKESPMSKPKLTNLQIIGILLSKSYFCSASLIDEQRNLFNNKMVKLGKLNFGLNVKIIENVMCANFRDSRLRDGKLGHLKQGENGGFCVKTWLICYNAKATKRGKLKFGWVLVEALWIPSFGRSRSRDRNFWCRKWAKSEQIWTGISW